MIASRASRKEGLFGDSRRPPVTSVRATPAAGSARRRSHSVSAQISPSSWTSKPGPTLPMSPSVKPPAPALELPGQPVPLPTGQSKP
jgi:hypothetical protein